MASVPSLSFLYSAPTRLTFSISRNARRAVAITAWPAGVTDAMRLPARTKTRTPSSSSSWRTCLLTPGCDVNSAAAASDTLRPWSTMAHK
jgi:hypothetical protein